MRAAATAVTPLPLVNWLAAGGARGGPLTDRIAELAAGAAPAGAAATLAKAGTIAVVAGSAFTGPALVDRLADRPQRDATASAATETRPASPARQPVTVAGERGPVRRLVTDVRVPQRRAGRRERDGSGRSTRQRHHGPNREERRHEDAAEHLREERSGRDGDDEAPDEVVAEHEDGSGSDGGRDAESEDLSGSGGGDETQPDSSEPSLEPIEAPTPPATPDGLEDVDPDSAPHGELDPESADPGPG
jgi:hypothetical protein